MSSQGIQSIDVLAVVEPTQIVRGEDLAFASGTFDERGDPAVAFVFNEEGSQKMEALTTTYSPVSGVFTQLGVILDDRLLTAPKIHEPIKGEARITGHFTQAEVDSIVQTLKAGQLPAKLNPRPVSETQTTATYTFLDRLSS